MLNFACNPVVATQLGTHASREFHRAEGFDDEIIRAEGKTAGFGVPRFVPKWRAREDSNF